jgi:hypothetical protein
MTFSAAVEHDGTTYDAQIATIERTRTVGCRNWEALKGAKCLVLRVTPRGLIAGIADLDAERVLIFKEHAAKWFPEDVEAAS